MKRETVGNSCMMHSLRLSMMSSLILGQQGLFYPINNYIMDENNFRQQGGAHSQLRTPLNSLDVLFFSSRIFVVRLTLSLHHTAAPRPLTTFVLLSTRTRRTTKPLLLKFHHVFLPEFVTTCLSISRVCGAVDLASLSSLHHTAAPRPLLTAFVLISTRTRRNKIIVEILPPRVRGGRHHVFFPEFVADASAPSRGGESVALLECYPQRTGFRAHQQAKCVDSWGKKCAGFGNSSRTVFRFFRFGRRRRWGC